MQTARGVQMAFLLVAILDVTSRGGAQEMEKKAGKAALTKALQSVTFPLERGMTAAQEKGTVISAKYELDDNGKLQLSVYTAQGGGFSEVIIDHATGKLGKTSAITEGGDLKDARSQQAAMAKAKRSLQDVVAKAVSRRAGYRAVSVTPGVRYGNPTAAVMLLKGTTFATTSVRLD